MPPLNSVSWAKSTIETFVDEALEIEHVNLTNCDREPIHIPNAIQPYGVLFVFDSNTDRVIQVSQNINRWLNQSAQSLLDQPLSAIFSESSLQNIQAHLAKNLDESDRSPVEVQFHSEAYPLLEPFNGIIHRQNHQVILELEPIDTGPELNAFQFSQTIKVPTERLQRTETLEQLCQVAVQEVQRLTQFDRVMIYRFTPDGSGCVVAEALTGERTSYVGLRYPATDIPQQAKALYTLNWLRSIPTIDYDPVPLISSCREDPPLDMSAIGLRSVSPLHLEYLRNMGVQSSMSISLLCQGELWGLIACHHHQPKILDVALRTSCEFIGQILSSELAAKEQRQTLEVRLKHASILAELSDSIQTYDSLKQGLTQSPQDLMDLVNAQGVAYIEQHQMTLLGQTPTQAQLRVLLPTLEDKFKQESLYCTHTLSRLIPDAETFESKTCGLLGLSISTSQKIYLLWFRPEQLQFIDWAGDPNKPMEIDENGQAYLTPRSSFERWVETIRLHSEPWKPAELQSALELRSAIIGLVLQKADELAQVNTELARSNDELAAFAYVASHDLKAPLRAIANLACWLQEDLEGQIPEENQKQLDLMQSRVYRMNDMINGLLSYSRASSQDGISNVVFPDFLTEIVDSLSPPETFTITFPTSPLMFKTNKILLKQVLTNLLSNAIKYVNRVDAQIEILIHERAHELQFEVKDNGPGIEPAYYDKIFQLFQILQSRDDVESTGIGLAIVKKVVQDVGGRVWVSANEGTGCIFTFTWPYS